MHPCTRAQACDHMHTLIHVHTRAHSPVPAHSHSHSHSHDARASAAPRSVRMRQDLFVLAPLSAPGRALPCGTPPRAASASQERARCGSRGRGSCACCCWAWPCAALPAAPTTAPWRPAVSAGTPHPPSPPTTPGPLLTWASSLPSGPAPLHQSSPQSGPVQHALEGFTSPPGRSGAEQALPAPAREWGAGRELVLGPGVSLNCHSPKPPHRPRNGLRRPPAPLLMGASSSAWATGPPRAEHARVHWALPWAGWEPRAHTAGAMRL